MTQLFDNVYTHYIRTNTHHIYILFDDDQLLGQVKKIQRTPTMDQIIASFNFRIVYNPDEYEMNIRATYTVDYYKLHIYLINNNELKISINSENDDNDTHPDIWFNITVNNSILNLIVHKFIVMTPDTIKNKLENINFEDNIANIIRHIFFDNQQ